MAGLPFGRQQHGKIVNVHHSWTSVDGEPGAVNPLLALPVVAHKGKLQQASARGLTQGILGGLLSRSA
ncbi:MAG TPA: hypothetical protein VFR88_09310 [Microlunatus sp.]|nr:hypothetical protein [Microlunatus sp.]